MFIPSTSTPIAGPSSSACSEEITKLTESDHAYIFTCVVRIFLMKHVGIFYILTENCQHHLNIPRINMIAGIADHGKTLYHGLVIKSLKIELTVRYMYVLLSMINLMQNRKQ
jgi:hypothetical protein